MTLYSGTPTTLVAGDTSALVTKFNDHRDALKGLSEPRTSYTPTYAGGITAIGDAVVSAKYGRVDKDIRGHVRIVFGSTSTFGAGGFIIGLPVATHADRSVNAAIGSGFLLDGGASGTRTSAVVFTLSSTTVALLGPTTGGTVGQTSPWTWASTDILDFHFAYEAA